MKATLEIHRNGYPDPKPIVLTKEHVELSVLRHWQDSVLERQSPKVLVIGDIDGSESFIRGGQMSEEEANKALESAFTFLYEYLEEKLESIET